MAEIMNNFNVFFKIKVLGLNRSKIGLFLISIIARLFKIKVEIEVSLLEE